ncbi:MAG TPA: hypothetical protein VF791_11700, partial [Pyrinomonadaceae bacterium]
LNDANRLRGSATGVDALPAARLLPLGWKRAVRRGRRVRAASGWRRGGLASGLQRPQVLLLLPPLTQTQSIGDTRKRHGDAHQSSRAL